MLKPRCGFYITEKFPKSPKPPEGEEVLRIPEDAFVLYDPKEFSRCSEKEFKEYCEELILYYGLEWDLEEFMENIQMLGFISVLPKNKEKMKKVLKENPYIHVEFKDERKKKDA